VGRPKPRWEGVGCEGVDWIHLDSEQSLVAGYYEHGMKIWVP
jgi:hypothetical protein